VHDERLHGAERHLIADLLDGFSRVVGVVLFEIVLRRVVALAAPELLDRPRHDRVIAGHPHLVHRVERVHHADHVRRPELGVDKAGERRARRDARAFADVIVVEKHREQAHVVPRGFSLLVFVVANRPGRAVGGGRDAAVQLDQLEVLDALRLAVLGELEVALLQIRDGISILVADDHVHADEIDAAAEDGDRGLVLSVGWILLGRLAVLGRRPAAPGLARLIVLPRPARRLRRSRLRSALGSALERACRRRSDG
jgi:hypothetical protein